MRCSSRHRICSITIFFHLRLLTVVDILVDRPGDVGQLYLPVNNRIDRKVQYKIPLTTTMTDQMDESRPETIQSCNNLFSSADFGRFLSNEFPSTNAFLSKDDALPSFEAPSIFKSKDSFSQMYSGPYWQMKFTKSEPPAQEESCTKTCPPVAAAAPVIQRSHSLDSLHEDFSSKDWVASNTLGPHVDVSINQEMLLISNEELSPCSDVSSALPSRKTDWDSMFLSQLLRAPSEETLCSSTLPEPQLLVDNEIVPCSIEALPHLHVEQASTDQVASCDLSSNSQSETEAPRICKKKRVRKPRQKVVPEVKAYVTPMQNDVLLGRGGRSNHHPGNKRYREEVKNLRGWYLSIGDNKDEKTALSQLLVDYVHGYNGRFLEKDKNGWYVVPNIVARRKASQALREDNDPEKRAAKRARFQQKKLAEKQST